MPGRDNRFYGDKMKVLISGVAGFIGAHTAARFLREGATVIGFDNLSRRGNTDNLEWLLKQPGDFRFVHADLRRDADLDRIFEQENNGASGEKVTAVIHLGGQVAVTTSVAHPRLDFEAKPSVTLNMLESTRKFCPSAAFIFASTNKVYGGLEHIAVCKRNGRYEYADHPDGVTENEPLDFHSPYGCSKGAADQYVRDYARIYGLRTVVFRQSLYLRRAPIRSGGPGLGRLVHHRRPASKAHDGLRRRDADSRTSSG